jgi:hypothetical protein
MIMTYDVGNPDPGLGQAKNIAVLTRLIGVHFANHECLLCMDTSEWFLHRIILDKCIVVKMFDKVISDMWNKCVIFTI